MSKKIALKGQIKTYIVWPLWMIAPAALFTLAMYFLDEIAGITATVFFAIYLAAALFFYFHGRENVVNELISFATQYGQVQRQLLRELEIPYALLDESGRIIWTNDAFERTLHTKKSAKKTITAFMPDITKESLPSIENETEKVISHDERDYRVSMRKVSMSVLMEASEIVESVDNDSYLVAVYLFDVTETNRLQKMIEEQKLSCGLIYIDNYEEVLESVEEVRRSLLGAIVDRKINKYFSSADAIIKKLEKDKYIILMQKQNLAKITEKRFDILEDIKTINIGNDMSVTLSIGFGIDSDSFVQNYEYARAAIDLSLGRGGDQAIIKSNDEITYYGGKSQMAEKSTRVKARVKAHALKEIIENSERIIIMGHKLPDADAFGSAVGIYRIARTLNKKANIVVDKAGSSVKTMMDMITGDGNHEDDIIMSDSKAVEAAAAEGTTLVIVDVNRPSYTECPELVQKCSSVVVLDHHRQGSEKIENATLSYIEPYASSASEMVAEVLQYISNDVRLLPDEADCLYSGIMIDTNNFMVKTGVRTFEAAAYLRRNGADVTRVRKMFREDMSDYRIKAEIVRGAEIFEDSYAVATCPDNLSESPTIIAAQAANELLTINGIKASFVLALFRGEVFISARSIDEVNVQLIMEHLGGGGHLSVAGAQLPGITVEEAKEKLRATIKEMKEKGEI